MKSATTKKIFLGLWLIATAFWATASCYIFETKNIFYAYRQYDRFASKVAHGRPADPYHYDYYLRNFADARERVHEANILLGYFFLVAAGLPGILLAVGMRVIDTVERRKRAPRN